MIINTRRVIFLSGVIFLPFQAVSAQGKLNVSGTHANEPFCKTMIKQFETMTTYTQSGLGLTDLTARKKYFADQKMLNAMLVKTAPVSLTADVALLSRDVNGSYDAQLGTDREAIMAAIAPLRRPDHLAAAKRANAYCGFSLAK